MVVNWFCNPEVVVRFHQRAPIFNKEKLNETKKYICCISQQAEGGLAPQEQQGSKKTGQTIGVW
jgi:hypothetical protein